MKFINSKNSSESAHTAAPFLSGDKKGSFFSSSLQNHHSFFGPSAVQPKLEIGQPNDKYEQEADRVADTVMRMADPQIQGQPVEEEEELQMKREDTLIQQECEEEEKLQKKSDGKSISADYASNISSQIASQSGTGNRLPKPVRSEMAHKMGADFSGVNIHTSPDAHELSNQLGARAFTHGSDIYFNKGEYNPDSSEGKHLLAHELTHVMQQDGAQSSIQNLLINRQILQLENEGYTNEFFNLEGVQQVGANMRLRFHKTIDYTRIARTGGDVVKNKLVRLSNQYERAWIDYAEIIRLGRLEARNQEQWTNICVGIGAGIIIGLGAAYVFPTAAAGSFAIASGEVAGVVGSSAGQAAIGAAISSELTEAMRPAGTELEPQGLSPAVLRMEVWQNVSQLYRSASILSEASRNLHMLAIAAEYLSGEIRVHVAGGQADMDVQSVLDMMMDLVDADQDMRDFDEELSHRLSAVEDLYERARSLTLENYSKRQMEQDIWILWMADLNDPSVLDLDEIEDYLHGNINILGPSSILGIDFGGWTTEEDEQEAKNEAQIKALEIRQRLRNLRRGSIEH